MTFQEAIMRKQRPLTAALAAALLWTGGTGGTSASEFPQVRFVTNAGSFIVQLDDNRAPLTVANFLQYVNDGFYTGTIFHRVVDGFVVQGGGLGEDLQPKPTRATIPNESGNGLSNRRGTIAMARTGDPHSADSQFYLNLKDNATLDPLPTRWGYAVFGEVIVGMNVIDDIGHRATTIRGDFREVPVIPVMIERAEVLTERIAR
jgi:peptidyl-prolyl cis-trans isomerase A (cyclophilin A)